MAIDLIDTAKPKNSGTFPIAEATDVKGGHHEVADNTARDAIPAARRTHGMLVFVQASGTTYSLGSDLTTWTPFVTGGDLSGPASATDNAVARFDTTTGKLVQNSAVTIDDSGNIATAGTVDGRDVSTDGAKLDTVTVANIPSATEKAALAGTGTPSGSNKFVTNDDSRLTNSRTPTAHAITHKGDGSDPIADASGSVSGLMPASAVTKLASITVANIPTAGEKLALAGTIGTPGSANKYVTDTDERIGAKATADIVLTVTTGGNDSDPARPPFITGGDYTAYPYRQIQAALDDCARQLGNRTALIDVGVGDFDGFATRGFIGPSTGVAIRGTWSLATLTTGPNSFTANTGTNATTLKRRGGVAWTTNNLRGKAVWVTSGGGFSGTLVNESVGYIISNDADTAIIGGYGIFGLDSTSVVQIVRPGTRINMGSPEPALAADAGISVFGNISDVILSRLKIEFTDSTFYGLVTSSNSCQLVVQGCVLGSGFHYMATDSYHYWNANYLEDGAAVYFDNVRAIASYGLVGGDAIIDVSKFTSAIFDYTDMKGATGNALKISRGVYALVGLNANSCTATPLVLRNVHNQQVGAAGLTGTNAGTTYFADIAESGQYELAGASGAGSGTDQVLLEGKSISYTTLGAQGTTRRRGSIIHWGSGRERMLQKIYIPVDGADPGDELATDGDLVAGGRIKHYGQHTLLGAAGGTVTAAGASQGTAAALKYVFSNINAGTGGVILASSGIGSTDGTVIQLGFNRSGAAVNLYPPTGGTINSGSVNAAISVPNNGFFASASRGSNDFDVTVTLPESSLTLGNIGGTIATSQVAANAVTNAKLAQMAAHTFKGNNTGSTANALDLTATQLTAELDAFTTSAKGLAPASGGGTTNYLRADGTWAAPAGGGGGGSVATDTIFDAKGDLPVGTGADTAAKLTVGANDKVLVADSAQTTGVKWADPPLVDGSVTLAKMANLAQDQFIGRVTASTGVPETATITAAARTVLDDTTTSAMRTTLGVAIGSDVQAFDAELAAIAGLTSAADKGIHFTGAGTAATHDLTAAGRALIDDADASAQRTTLGLGTLATQSGTFSGTSSGTNTGDQTITLTGDVTGSGTGSFATTFKTSPAFTTPTGSGSTTGNGFTGTGGSTSGIGVQGTGGPASSGVKGIGGSTSGKGVEGAGTGTGSGVDGTGGATGVGVSGTGGSTSGAGVSGTGGASGQTGVVGTGGASSGKGVTGQGTGSGIGVQGTGGATNGTGVKGIGGATNGVGVIGTGTGGGDGVQGTGGSGGGAGGTFTGGTDGPGISAAGTGAGAGTSSTGGSTGGTGVVGLSSGGNGTGVDGTGNGTGSGVNGTGGGTSGVGVKGTGGSSNGIGVYGRGVGTGSGVKAEQTASGYALEVIADTTSPVKAAIHVDAQDAIPTGAHVIGDMFVTTAGVLMICTTAGTPGTWTPVALNINGAGETRNLGMADSVTSGILTLSLKQADGSTAPTTGAGAVRASMRNPTATTGGYVDRLITSALTLDLQASATLTFAASQDCNLWVYLVDTDGSGTMALGASPVRLDDSKLVGTVAASATVTMTIASPCVVTETGHNRSNNDIVIFSTSGALPTGVTAGTRYWISNVSGSTYRLNTSAGGTNTGGAVVNTSGTQSGTHTVKTMICPDRLMASANSATGRSVKLVSCHTFNLNSSSTWIASARIAVGDMVPFTETIQEILTTADATTHANNSQTSIAGLTSEKRTHYFFNVSALGSWFQALVSGKYRVTLHICNNTCAMTKNGYFAGGLFKNASNGGTQTSTIGEYTASVTDTIYSNIFATRDIDLAGGDYVNIAFINALGAAVAMDGFAIDNFISVTRIA